MENSQQLTGSEGGGPSLQLKTYEVAIDHFFHFTPAQKGFYAKCKGCGHEEPVPVIKTDYRIFVHLGVRHRIVELAFAVEEVLRGSGGPSLNVQDFDQAIRGWYDIELNDENKLFAKCRGNECTNISFPYCADRRLLFDHLGKYHKLVEKACFTIEAKSGSGGPSLISQHNIESESPSPFSQHNIESESPSPFSQYNIESESPSPFSQHNIESGSPSLVNQEITESGGPSLVSQLFIEGGSPSLDIQEIAESGGPSLINQPTKKENPNIYLPNIYSPEQDTSNSGLNTPQPPPSDGE